MASDSHAKRPIVVERRKEKGRKKTPRLTKTYDVKIIPATVGVVAETEEPPKKRVAASTTWLICPMIVRRFDRSLLMEMNS